MKVVDPAGQTWRVSRRWVPWRRRVPVEVPDDYGVSGGGDDPISMVLGLLALVLVLPFLVLGLVAALEVLLLALLVPFVALGRVLLGRHWVVEVRRGWQVVWEHDAGSWSDSAETIRVLGEQLRRGERVLDLR